MVIVPALLAAAAAIVATPAQPARLAPAIDAAARCSGQPQLVVSLVGFTVPSHGHATLAVSLRTDDGKTHALGEVGVFPEQTFASPPGQPQRFGFALPAGALARHPVAIVDIKADDPRGSDARAVIGAAQIVPAPQDHC